VAIHLHLLAKATNALRSNGIIKEVRTMFFASREASAFYQARRPRSSISGSDRYITIPMACSLVSHRGVMCRCGFRCVRFDSVCDSSRFRVLPRSRCDWTGYYPQIRLWSRRSPRPSDFTSHLTLGISKNLKST
jgi:hypothetical protein